MKNKVASMVIVLLLTFAIATTASASMFEANLNIDGTNISKSFNTAMEVVDYLKTVNISKDFPMYNPATSNVIGYFNYRGLIMNVSYVGTTLSLNIPAINESQNFQGATRDQSQQMFKDWLKKDGAEVLTKIMKWLAGNTATDPISGNPNSLAGRMASISFNRGFTDIVSQFYTSAPPVTTTKDAKEVNSNVVSIGASFGYYDHTGKDVKAYTLPLAYTFRSNDDDRRQLTLSLPLQIVDTEGAKSYNGGLGIAYSIPLTSRQSQYQWIVTPSFDYGAVGSTEMGTVGQLMQGTLTSAFTTKLASTTLSIGNMVGYYKSLKFSAGGYSIDPKISNTLFRNGIMVAFPTETIMKNSSVELFLIDTRVTGSNTYVKGYDEIGFSFGFVKPQKITPPALSAGQKEDKASIVKNILTAGRLGLSYLYSNKSKGFTVNFGYRF